MLDDHVILPSAYNIGPSQMGIGGGAGAATGGGVNGGLDGSMGDGVQVRWDPLAHPTIVEWLSEQQCSGGKQIDSEWLWSSNRAEASRGSRFISIPCQLLDLWLKDRRGGKHKPSMFEAMHMHASYDEDELLIVWAAAITLRNFTRNFLAFITKLEEHRAHHPHVHSMPDPPNLGDIGAQSGSGLGMSIQEELKEGELEEVHDDYDLSEQLRNIEVSHRFNNGSPHGNGLKWEVVGSIEEGEDFRNVITKAIMRTSLSVINVLIASAEADKERTDTRCDGSSTRQPVFSAITLSPLHPQPSALHASPSAHHPSPTITSIHNNRARVRPHPPPPARRGVLSEFEGELMRICLDTIDNVKHSVHNDEDWKLEVAEAMAGNDQFGHEKFHVYYGERFQEYAERIYSNESELQTNNQRWRRKKPALHRMCGNTSNDTVDGEDDEYHFRLRDCCDSRPFRGGMTRIQPRLSGSSDLPA
mmetsp:Transcript_63329/g.174149  ORF Transcript_63329/g.174149 Transcript_63329/m.174149 type:complete len:473 (-) Transcript_63329:231-1649(-)